MFLAIYLIISFNYTLEAFIKETQCYKHWYLIISILLGWAYFPYDLGKNIAKIFYK